MSWTCHDTHKYQEQVFISPEIAGTWKIEEKEQQN
jgi:hypothetical protein